jgi:hypothetical protein
MYKPSTYLVVTYFPTYLPTYRRPISYEILLMFCPGPLVTWAQWEQVLGTNV